MAARRTRAKDLKRRVGVRPERRTIVVYCEGEASEPDYLNGLKRLAHIRENAAIMIEIDTRSGVPLTLVERAVERKWSDPEVDEVWCVFDVEAPKPHPNLTKAMLLAATHDVRIAVSNPCFELWLILHFEDQTAFLSTAAAESKSRRLDGRKGKRIEPAAYLERRGIAVRRARSLAKRHEANGTGFPDDNPSSSMCDLLASIEREPDGN